jgi:hypothetical protein
MLDRLEKSCGCEVGIVDQAVKVVQWCKGVIRPAKLTQKRGSAFKIDLLQIGLLRCVL